MKRTIWQNCLMTWQAISARPYPTLQRAQPHGLHHLAEERLLAMRRYRRGESLDDALARVRVDALRRGRMGSRTQQG